MSLVKIPPELILEICSYLIPQSISVSEKPFSDWGREFRAEMWASAPKTTALYALNQTCQALHHILPRHPEHVHLFNPHMNLIQVVLRLPSIKTLSLFEPFSLRQYNGLFTGIPDGIDFQWDQTIEVASHDSLEPVNISIHTLRMLYFDVSRTNFKWLLARLQGLKCLHYEFRDHTIPLEDRVALFKETIMSISGIRLETLVLSLQKTNDSWEWGSGLSQTLPLKSLEKLTTLKISSFLLLGSMSALRYDKEVHTILPSSIVDLEVFFDRGIKYPFIAEPWYNPNDRTSPDRPSWLFQLLERKFNDTPKLERIRIISDEEYAHLKDSYIWKNHFVPHCQDWVKSDGKRNWKPPMELILAFEKAGVCFGLYIQPDVCFRLIIPGIQWFKDTWEGKWDRDQIGEGRVENVKTADNQYDQESSDEEFMNYEYDENYSDIEKAPNYENKETSQIETLEEEGDSDWSEQEDSDGE